MDVKPLISYLLRAVVTSVERPPTHIVVWIKPDGSDDNDQPIPVGFERTGPFVNQQLIDTADTCEPGDRVEIGYTQIGEAPAVINLGRSITKL